MTDPVPPLTDEEIKYTRAMITADKRVKWAMMMLRQFALWATAVVAAVYALKTFFIENIMGKHP